MPKIFGFTLNYPLFELEQAGPDIFMSDPDSPAPADMTPKFFRLLSEADILAYNQLRSDLSSPNCRNRRNKRLETFSEMLNSIKSFAIRKDEDDWKRCLVCGVLWLNNGIAINTRQLRLLINKCKSSINGSLHRMGYSTVMCRGDTSNQLVEMIPLLKNNFAELRQWTVRQANVCTPQPAIPRFKSKPLPVSASPQPYYHAPPMTHAVSQDFMPSQVYTDSLGPTTSQSMSFFDDELSLPLLDWAHDTDAGQDLGKVPDDTEAFPF